MAVTGGARPGAGRKKGIPNKTSSSAKEAILLAAQGLGGVPRMIAWAKEDPMNERAFWSSMYPKLVPHEVTGANGGPVVIEHSFKSGI